MPEEPQDEQNGRENRTWIPPYHMAVSNCLVFFHRQETQEGGEPGFFWLSRSNMSAHCHPCEAKDTVTFFVIDHNTEERVELWTSVVRTTGDQWRRRLRWMGGETVVLAQRRPRCRICRAEMSVRTIGPDSAQAFVCSRSPECPGVLAIVDHDIDRNCAAPAVVNQTQTANQAAHT